MAIVDFYYDFRSPFAYFSAYRICSGHFPNAAAIEWRWHPVSIDVLLNLQANRPSWATYTDPLAPPKRRHFLKDVVRNADFYKVPIRPPNPPRPDSAPALCASLALTQNGIEHDKFRRAIFEALWQRQEDIGSKSVLLDYASASNLPMEIVETAFSRDAREVLAKTTQSAYENGVFGVPSFVWNGEMFFGNDRLDMLIWYLNRERQT